MFNLPSVHIHRDTKNGQDALTVAEVGEVLDAPVRRRRKESGPSPLLKDPEDAAEQRSRKTLGAKLIDRSYIYIMYFIFIYFLYVHIFSCIIYVFCVYIYTMYGILYSLYIEYIYIYMIQIYITSRTPWSIASARVPGRDPGHGTLVIPSVSW